MPQIGPDGIPNNARFCRVPTPAGVYPLDFQTHKRADRQHNVVALGHRLAHLGALHATALLEATMVAFNRPALLRNRVALLQRQRQVIRHPIFRVTIWGNRPKYVNEAKALEMHLPSRYGNLNAGHRDIAGPIRVDQPIVLQAGQEVPAMRSHGLQVVETAVPTVETDEPGREPSFFRRHEHGAKVLVLGLTRGQGFVIDSTITGQGHPSISPHQRQQIDAGNHAMMFAAPMAGHQLHLTGIGFVQRRVIEQEQAGGSRHEGQHFLPQRRRVGRLSVQQAHKGIVRRWVNGVWCTLGGFRTRVDPLSGDQKLDIINICHFWWIHTTPVLCETPAPSTA
jgi:hypothetical protein